MKVIGITGGVGAGKSTVLHYITDHYKARLLVADEIAHDVMEPGGRCYEALREMFPDWVFQANGSIDRPRMAEAIFKDDSLRGRMNKLVHPAVGDVFKEEIAKERQQGDCDYCLLEAALFADTENDRLCDSVWYIRTDDEVRKKRLMENRGYSAEKVQAIMAAQKGEDVFLKSANVIIENDEDFNETIKQIETALAQID